MMGLSLLRLPLLTTRRPLASDPAGGYAPLTLVAATLGSGAAPAGASASSGTDESLDLTDAPPDDEAVLAGIGTPVGAYTPLTPAAGPHGDDAAPAGVYASVCACALFAPATASPGDDAALLGTCDPAGPRAAAVPTVGAPGDVAASTGSNAPTGACVPFAPADAPPAESEAPAGSCPPVGDNGATDPAAARSDDGMTTAGASDADDTWAPSAPVAAPTVDGATPAGVDSSEAALAVLDAADSLASASFSSTIAARPCALHGALHRALASPRVFGHAYSSTGGSATSSKLAFRFDGSDGNCGAILGSSWSCGGAVVASRGFRHRHPLRKTIASLPVDVVPAYATAHPAPTEGIGDDHSSLTAAGDAAPEAATASARAFIGSAPRWSTGTSRVHLRAVRSRAQVPSLTQPQGTREISSCCGNSERTTRLRLVGQPSSPSCMGILGDLDRFVILQFLDIELRGGTQEGG
jgi:hypothetical protein